MAPLTYTVALTAGTPENVNDLNTNLASIQASVNTIDTAQISASAITATQIAANAVTTAKILDANVTVAKLAAAVGNFGAWTSYTPTWTGLTSNPTLASHTLSCAYNKVGRLVTFRMHIVLGSTNYGSGTYYFGYPVPPSATTLSASSSGSFIIFDASANVRETYFASHDAASNTFVVRAPSGGGLFNNTTPYTLATSDTLSITGTYESAT